MLESLLRLLPSRLLRIQRANRVFELGMGARERFLCNELQNRLVQLSGRRQRATIRIIERRLGGRMPCLLRQAQRRFEVRNRHGRFACLGVRQRKIGLNSIVVWLYRLRSFEFLCSLERFALLHQHRAEGFVSFGDLRQQMYDFSKLRSCQFQVSSLACSIAFAESRVRALHGILRFLRSSLRRRAKSDAEKYAKSYCGSRRAAGHRPISPQAWDRSGAESRPRV